MSVRDRLADRRRQVADRRRRVAATVPGRILGAAIVLLLTGALLVGVITPPEHCPTPTVAELRGSATAAVDWFVRNQQADGRWLYQYDRATNDAEIDPEYNAIRHAGAILGLEQAATAGIPGARRSADRGTEWLLDRVIEREDWSAITYRGQTAVGTSALFVAALAERRATTGDAEHDELLGRLGRFLESQVEPSGAVLAYYDAAAGRPQPDTYSKYYTGEAYWALARLHRLFPDDGWGRSADRVGTYLATERDDAEGHRIAVPDHWAAYGLSETVGAPAGPVAPSDPSDPSAGADGEGDGAEAAEVGRGLTSDERAYARHQAGAFGAQVRWFAQRFGPWGVVTRGFRGVPRGGGYGVVGEALTGLWRVARIEPGLADIEGPVAERALCNAGQAIEAQATAADAADDVAPDRVAGAWFRAGETRMDDQQHMISALLRTEAIADAGPTGRDGPTPPAWLWIVALVAALNPLRVAVARRVRTNAPAAEHQARPAEPVVTAALGAAGGAVVVLGAALLADRLASLAHVSPPSLRLAAGALGIAGGLTALLLRPVSAAPIVSRRRWVGAAVPIGVAVANPALVVGGLAAGLDSGVAVVAISLVLGVAAVAAAVALDHRALDRSAPSVTGDGGSPAGDGGPEAAPVSVATGGTTGGAAGGTDGGGPGETAGRPSGPAEAGPVEAGPVEFGGAPVEAGGAPDGAGGAPAGAGGAPDGAERGDADRSPASGRTAWQRRVLTWGGRVTGVVLVVASALLIFDAVYAP